MESCEPPKVKPFGVWEQTKQPDREMCYQQIYLQPQKERESAEEGPLFHLSLTTPMAMAQKATDKRLDGHMCRTTAFSKALQ